jgi:competence protein ComEC
MHAIAFLTKFRFESILADFWQHHPAVLYSYAALLGSSFALYSIGPIFSLLSLFFLIFPLLTRKRQTHHLRILLSIILAFTTFCFSYGRYHFPDPGIKPGIAEMEMISVRLAKTAFGYVWKYQATLKSFIYDDRSIADNIPVTVSIPYEKETLRPTADSIYQIPARLKTTSQGKYIINPIKNAPWIALGEVHNLAEWRFQAKAAVQKHINESMQDPHAKAFLSGIATGEFDDRLLSHELGRFGLQHLMAISGLHFSILSSLLLAAFGLIFSRRLSAIFTSGAMSAYFLFLGASASVTRAWIALVIGLASYFLQRRSSGLNALGVGALVMILLNPLALEEIGFQFSFGVTAAILLWFSPCDAFLQRFFGKRRLSEAITMDAWDQHGYCVLHFLRQSLALSLAVNLTALPLTLYHFHNFPIMGLIYNLFFPFLMSFSLVLLVLGCFFSILVPWLGALLHHFNESYTKFMLDLTFNLPKAFDLKIHLDHLPKEGIMIYLLILFVLGIVLNTRKEQLIEIPTK